MSEQEILNRRNVFIEKLKQDKMIQKNLYNYTYLTGSSTTVNPITASKCDITLLWKSNRNCSKWLDKIIEKNSDLIKYAYHRPSDGSWPAEIVFKLLPEYCF